MAHFPTKYPPTDVDAMTLVTDSQEVDHIMAMLGLDNRDPTDNPEDTPSYYSHLLVLVGDGEYLEVYGNDNAIPWVWAHYDCIWYGGGAIPLK